MLVSAAAGDEGAARAAPRSPPPALAHATCWRAMQQLLMHRAALLAAVAAYPAAAVQWMEVVVWLPSVLSPSMGWVVKFLGAGVGRGRGSA